AVAESPALTASESESAPAKIDFAWPSTRQLVLTVWLIGSLGFLLRSLVGLSALYSCFWRSRPVHDPEWIACLKALARQHGLGKQSDIGLYDNPVIDSPLTLGLWRPVILLPVSRSSWTAEQRDLILAHELAHVRRRDFLTSLVAELAACIYWFH